MHSDRFKHSSNGKKKGVGGTGRKGKILEGKEEVGRKTEVYKGEKGREGRREKGGKREREREERE
jgi:hypothetical protein